MKVNIISDNNSLIKYKLTKLKNKNTCTKEFRELIREVSILLCYEVMKDIKLIQKQIETPITKTVGYFYDENNYLFVPILRAGLGMVDGILKVIPNAKIGHIGLYRDEDTLLPVKYYYKMPSDIEKKEVIVLDPMLATGGSASATINFLKKDGVKRITLLCIISAPEGIKKINIEHPDVNIITAEVNDKLNENGYIVPGLGDAGDRMYGIK